MINKSTRGIRPTSRSDDHANVEWQTKNITPTRVAMGTWPSSGAAPRMPAPRKRENATPDTREVPPDCTLIKLWRRERARSVHAGSAGRWWRATR